MSSNSELECMGQDEYYRRNVLLHFTLENYTTFTSVAQYESTTSSLLEIRAKNKEVKEETVR